MYFPHIFERIFDLYLLHGLPISSRMYLPHDVKMVSAIPFENIALELVGLLFPALVAYAATQHFAFEPLVKGESKATNDMYIAAVPAVVYLAARLYMGFTYLIFSILPDSYRKLVTINQCKAS